MTTEINKFVDNTARDYDLPYDICLEIYNDYYNDDNAMKFYDEMEKTIKEVEETYEDGNN